jgi:lysophospholipase L1-like esterase
VLVLILLPLLTLALRRRNRPGTPPGWRVLGGLTGALGILACLELALRIYEFLPDDHPNRYHPQRRWALRPNWKGSLPNPFGTVTEVHTNSLGLRDQTPLEKAPREFRILCLGDSWTFGQSVPAQDTFAERLEELVRQKLPGRPVSVINAGQPGYSYRQGYLLLQEILPAYQPDLVMLCGFNYLSDQDVAALEAARPTCPLLASLARGLERSRVCLLVRKQYLRLRPPTFQPPDPQALERAVSRYLGLSLQAARSAGVPVVVFDHAFNVRGPGTGWPAYASLPPLPQAPHLGLSQFPEWARQDPQVVAVDLLPLDVELERMHYMGWLDSVHPGSSGHQAMARALLQVLEDHSLLPQP